MALSLSTRVAMDDTSRGDPLGAKEKAGRPVDRRKGSVLLVVLVVTLVLTLTMAAALSTTRNVSRQSRWQLERTEAFAIAEGITEGAKKLALDQVSRFESPRLSGTVAIDGEDCPYTMSGLGNAFRRTEPDGLLATIQRYRISASVERGGATTTVERVVDLTKIPLFRYMIFYTGDLEIFPGPRMNLDGPVHAGGDLWVDAGEELVVDSEYFRSSGRIERRARYGGSELRGAVRIKVAGESLYRNLTAAGDASRRDWPSFALARWNGSVQDGAHRVPRIAAPGISSLKAFLRDGTKGYYHSHADLVIVDQVAYETSGARRPLPAGTISERSMYDAREGKSIAVTEIDLRLLGNAGAFPRNGLIYAYRTDASPRQPNGIRLANGAELHGPLTLASEDPVFIRGDFNTVDKKPAAVLADAVNLLSSAWDDSRTATVLPAATETQYNFAFVTGNVPSRHGRYSGGFEHLPRLHENWSGVTARIRGSFVCLFESEIATAPWRTDSVYSPPLRDWRFDPALTKPGGLPPFAPVGACFQDILWDDRVPLPFALK